MGIADTDWTFEWTQTDGLQYELWSDLALVIAQHYGALETPDAADPLRYAFVLGPDGQVVLEYKDWLELGPQPGDLLDDLEALYGE